MITLLAACAAPPGEPPPLPVRSGDSGTIAAPSEPRRPALVSPAAAVDLDPDPDVLHVALTAAPHAWEVAGIRVDGSAYNGQVPGPTLRARIGDAVVVDITNALPEATTVHWHGVRVPIAMDGAGWPMETIPPGGTFQARFTVDRPGTFWYHPHFDTAHQVDRGLYGALIVEDPDDPLPDVDLVAVFDTVGEPEAMAHDPHLVDASLTDWTVNGQLDPVLAVPAGAVVRARLVNASNAGYLDLRGDTVIAHDQGLLAAPEEGVVLAPGDRAELEWRVGGGFTVNRHPYTVAGGVAHGDPVRLLEVRAEGAADPPAPLPWAFSGAPPSADPGRTDIRLLFSGSPELGWEIDGQTFPDVVVPQVALGQPLVIEVRNASPAIHPFHLHGHTFEVLSVDGAPPPSQRIEDTVDVPVHGRVRLALVADNPGVWMMHCHVLAHADGGMMTLLDVRE